MHSRCFLYISSNDERKAVTCFFISSSSAFFVCASSEYSFADFAASLSAFWVILRASSLASRSFASAWARASRTMAAAFSSASFTMALDMRWALIIASFIPSSSVR